METIRAEKAWSRRRARLQAAGATRGGTGATGRRCRGSGNVPAVDEHTIEAQAGVWTILPRQHGLRQFGERGIRSGLYTAYMLYNDSVPISGKAIVKRLKQEGWTVKSQSGSHVKLENEFAEIVIVPVHGNKDLGKGLVKKIEKKTGVKLI